MQRFIVIGLLIVSVMLNVAKAAGDESIVTQIDSKARPFFFSAGSLPYAHYDDFFAIEKLKPTFEKLMTTPKVILERLGNYQSYGCTHKNTFTDGVSTEMERAILLPKSLVPSSEDPVSWALTKVTEHMSSPAGKPMLGNLESYRYHLDDSGKMINFDKYRNDDLGPKLSTYLPVRIKYCLDLPLLSPKCNTIIHRAFRIDQDTQILASAMFDLKNFPDSKEHFEHDDQRQNVNDRGNGILLVRKVGENILIYEHAMYHTSKGSAVKEFKLFDKKISRDQCEKNTGLLIKRLGLEKILWKEIRE